MESDERVGVKWQIEIWMWVLKGKKVKARGSRGAIKASLISDPVIKALSVNLNRSETVQLPVRIPGQGRNIYLKIVKE